MAIWRWNRTGNSPLVITIARFETLDLAGRDKARDILTRALAPWAAYQDRAEAQAEVRSFLANAERLAFAALEEGTVRGWIGAIRVYDHGWELHPLVVDPDHHGSGIGTLLVQALEDAARAENVLTLYVGTDDTFGGTNVCGVDLFADLPGYIRTIAPVKEHPLTFYRRLGFAVIGLLPDVNGPGKPDVLMAKRLTPSTA
jgi:aminoglycoside 6'-N-acetyltransferase I